LLGLMIPLFGIGKVPAVIALVVYALLPILRNTYTGINEVDSSLIEAAKGIGMKPGRRLTKVELPIAMPVIMAGIRTAMVMIIGKVSAVIALVVYALLTILRNTYTGINEVDSSLIEAAKGIGMKPGRRLTKVELPIAMPVIMAGIRTAMVLIIGTATLAALIGAGGLGDLILLGIDRNDTSLIIIGAIPAALLAILFDLVLRYMQKLSYKKLLISLGAIIIILLLVI